MNTAEYGSSLLGTLTVAALAGVAFCVKNKFKHSECDMDSGCLKIKSHEDSETRNTIRREILDELRREGVLPPEVIIVKGEPSLTEVGETTL